MANFGQLILTNVGIQEQYKAQAGEPLKFKRIGLGSGKFTGNIATLTDLVSENVSVDIAKGYMRGNAYMVEGFFSNEDLQTGFAWREIGLFVEDADGNEILYCYANAGDTYDFIPATTDERYTKYIRIATAIGNATNVSIVENGSLVYVDTQTFNTTIEELRTELSSINAENLKGILPVSNGGTGVSKLDELYAGYAYHLAPNNCSNKDFNTLKKAGYYFGYTNMANASFTNEISVLEVIPYSNDWVLQRQTRLTDGVTKQRYYWGGSGWSDWCVIYTSAKHDGIAHITYGNYTGNGNYGSNNPNIITVDFTPKFMILDNQWICQRGYSYFHNIDSNATMNITWGTDRVSWYGDNAGYQSNTSGKVYSYVIIG